MAADAHDIAFDVRHAARLRNARLSDDRSGRVFRRRLCKLVGQFRTPLLVLVAAMHC